MNKLVLDFFPLILFGLFYWWKGIYWGTGAAIAGSILQVAYLYVTKQKISVSHWITLAVLVVFGGMTLLLQDDRFIKLKPSIVNIILGIMVVGPQLIGKTPALKLLMGEQITLPDEVWKKACWSWSAFMFTCAALNIYVAFYYGVDTLDEETRTNIWVNFKIFGLMGLTILFVLIQTFWLARQSEKFNPSV